MTCSFVKIGGNDVIICGRNRVEACHVCQAISEYLCDWKVEGGTCDAAMCEEHRHNVRKNRDLCFRHMNAWKSHPANRQAELDL